MLTGYPLSCTLGRSVLGIGSGVARFLMIAGYAIYRYFRCVVNVMLLLSQLSVSYVDNVINSFCPSKQDSERPSFGDRVRAALVAHFKETHFF